MTRSAAPAAFAQCALRAVLAALVAACAMGGTPASHARQAATGEPVVRSSIVAGTIVDAAGVPVPGCRVVTRQVEGDLYFVSPPSAEDGTYRVLVPQGQRYVIVALVSPTGKRLGMPGENPIVAGASGATRDVTLPMSMAPAPRKGGKDLGGVDRLFLSFVEDPALVGRQYYEAQVEFADFDRFEALTLRAVLAWQFKALPQVELGARGGFADFASDVPGVRDASGATDVEVWAKLDFYRSSTGRMDVGAGALLTVPTGDEAEGLGTDALQSKFFLAGSYSLTRLALIGNVGVRASENGMRFGVPLEGKVAGSVGLGLFFPLGERASLVAEAVFESERFENVGEDGRAAIGFNWSAFEGGQVRGALAAGLVDEAPDVQALISFAYRF